jgi:Zn ribbon nucleic-acid-binding protein
MEYRFPTSSFNTQYVVQSGFQIQPTSQQYFTRYSPSSVMQQQGGGGGGGARLEPAAEIIDSKGGENLNSTSNLNLNQLARPRPRHPIQTLQQGEGLFHHTSSSSSSSLTPPPGLTIPQRYSFGAAPTPLQYDQRRPHSTTIIQDLGSSSLKDETNHHESRQIYSVSTSATPVPLPLPPQQLPSSPPVSPSRKEDVIHVIPSPPQQQEQRNLAAFPFSVQNITPSTSSFPPSSSTAQLILPPRGGITPATLHPHPSSLPISPPQVFSSTTLEDAIATCQVEGCQFPRFCCLSPCGDMICRDHLGSVIRGVKLLPKQKRKGGSSGREEDEGEIEMVKVFECVRCRKQSEMVGPTPHQQRDKEKSLRERQQRQMVNNLPPHQHQQQYLGIQGYPHYYHYGLEPSMNMVGLGIDSLHGEVGEIDRGGGFSIHYLSNGPTGGGGGMSHEYQRSRFAASSETTLGEGELEKRWTNPQRDQAQQSFSFSPAVSHHKSRPVPDSTNPPNSFPKQTSYGVGLVSKPPSPPYPVQFYGSPESEASIAQSYYQPSFEGSPTAIRLDVDSLESTQVGAGTEIRIELEPQEVIDADYQPSPSITSQKENAGKTPPLSASSSTPEVVIFEDVESQTVEPFLLDSPPIPTSRCLPVPIVSTPPSPATTLQHLTLEEEAVHLLSEDPSIVSVSRTTCSPPQTPTQEIKKPLESDWSIPPSPLESPISPSVNQSSPQAYTASPFPAFHQHPSSSSSFADISTSPTRGRGRGTRGSHRRGGSRGWDPNIARERRGSIAATTTTTASSIQEEQDDSGWNFVETRQEPEVQLEFHKKRREQVEEEFRGKYSIVKIENVSKLVYYFFFFFFEEDLSLHPERSDHVLRFLSPPLPFSDTIFSHLSRITRLVTSRRFTSFRRLSSTYSHDSSSVSSSFTPLPFQTFEEMKLIPFFSPELWPVLCLIVTSR